MSEEQNKERHLPDGVILNNRYKIIRFLSAGGFGNTYEAEDIDEGSHVAVKELFISGTCKREEDSRNVSISVAENRELFRKQKLKFRKEAARLRQINHPGVVKVSDEFEENGTAYYVMDFVRGKSLEDMRDAGQLNEKKSVQYIKQVLSAIEAVHEKGILHMDIKPSNVMINENNKAIVIDFGASKQLETVDGKSLSLSTGIAYTPGYAPIEQMAGKRENIGIPADIYAIGATLYKLITGVTPPDPSELTTNGLPEIKASPEVQAAIKASVQNNYKARPQSVAEFRAILNGSPTPEPKPNPKPKPKPGGTEIIGDNPSPRPRWLMPLLIGLGVLVVGVIAFFAFNAINSDNDPIDSADTTESSTVPTDTVSVPAELPAEVPAAPAVDVVDEAVDEGYSVAYAGALNLYNSRKYSECKRECQKLLRQYTSREQKQQLTQLIEYCDTALAAEEAAQQQSAQQQPATSAATPATSSGGSSANLPDRAVDLGLSVLWADRNVGASSPSDYGGYYAWGETSTKSNYTWDTYQYFHDQDGNGVPYDSDWNVQANELTNIGSNIAGTRYDVARQKWGGGWKIPTKAQFEELRSKCTWTWTSQGGHNGYKVTGPNGNSIFLPAAGYRDGTSSRYVGSNGYYWSSSLSESFANYAWGLYFDSGTHVVYSDYRSYGRTVRPVTEK